MLSVDTCEHDLTAALNNNLVAAVSLARCALPFMREQRWGRIVCIASYTVVQAVPNLSLSNTARLGLWGWVKGAAHDLKGSGVTVNMACPGTHATDRMRALYGERLREVELAAMGAPQDFGSAVTFLCSEQARFINGAKLVVDGGETLAV